MIEQDCCHSFSSRYVDKLREHGHRLTKTRKLVANCLETIEGPFSTKDLHQSLINQGHENFDFATVYRNIQTLAQLELIHSIPKTGRYIKCNSKHSCLPKSVHVIYRCDRCESVNEEQLDQDLVGSIYFMTKQMNDNFEAKGVVLELSGQCSDCKTLS